MVNLESQLLVDGAYALVVPLPKFVQRPCGPPESHKANPQEQMGPGDSSARLEMKYQQPEALPSESSLPQDKLRKTCK